MPKVKLLVREQSCRSLLIAAALAANKAVGNVWLYEKVHSCFTLDRRGIEKSTSLAEAMINLLKGDDVGANVSDYVDDAIRSDYSIRASTFVDVVWCNLHGDLNSMFSYIGHQEPRRCVTKLHDKPTVVDFLQSDRLNAPRVDVANWLARSES